MKKVIWFITKRGASSPLAGGQVSTTLSSPWGVEQNVHSVGEPEDSAVHTCPFLLQTSLLRGVFPPAKRRSE